MRPAAWLFVAALSAAALVVIGENYRLLRRAWRAAPGEKTPSLVPFVGGVLAFAAVRLGAALRLGPASPAMKYALLAAVLDPGCYVLLVPLALLKRRR